MKLGGPSDRSPETGTPAPPMPPRQPPTRSFETKAYLYALAISVRACASAWRIFHGSYFSRSATAA